MEPKTFYRNFDDLLERIQQQRPKKDFICSILKEVQSNFGGMLRLGNLRIYEDRGNEFVLVRTFGSTNNNYTRTLATDSEAVRQVLKHGSYIYDQSGFSIDPGMSQQGYYAIPAALVIQAPHRRWIAIFELNAGWVREEVLFALNAIRSALNYRMFSENIQTELQQAAQIQTSLLPQQMPDVEGYEIAGRSQPTEIVGGDLFDFYEFNGDVFGFSIGDASGHGLPAALLVRDVVIGLRMGLEKNMKMVYTFQKLNTVIHRSTYSSRFVSLFYGEIEKNGHLIYVNAGQPPPFLVHGNQIEDLKATGLILGALPEITLHRSYAHMDPNSVLVLYTDGLFERENQNEESYSIKRLKNLVKQNQHKSAQDILDLIFAEVDEFGNHRKWEDDSSLVVIKRIGE
ncbi:PP2C family protein-serine/threonine phosphatase [candidate division KSB1 bacterium]|nr:PP2C family protein-serine/threonine phosphatase [candidate division KSB1 bacterium]NIR68532.1 PP2C family protein-serine/threonine phosphatase [candidate division KSB1 bacterium]NIS22759.1 PP2C family protein-serine/threonine phosphatase [candidate division KSB1 bacterium]NIT69390.1 PP2C family protein-serine/threonine phosphatase [candidate division KSB1 bacterium]NIU23267.1 PP2C family protein-serine/threonine phosphatase [candidate division KSB1 bacterium]